MDESRTKKQAFNPYLPSYEYVPDGEPRVFGDRVYVNYTGNTHGGMAYINGQWYIFYHRQTNKQKCARQGCAEKLTILPDGSIPQAEVTSCGLNAEPLLGKGVYEARTACIDG